MMMNDVLSAGGSRRLRASGSGIASHAAAVRCGAQGIVTFNTRYFPAEAVCRFDIQVIHPDKFLAEQLCQDETLALAQTLGIQLC
jgi:hypothetical protein